MCIELGPEISVWFNFVDCVMIQTDVGTEQLTSLHIERSSLA